MLLFRNSGITPSQLTLLEQYARDITSLLSVATKGAYRTPLEALLLPLDEQVLNTAQQIVNRMGSPKLVVVIGIGGSSLPLLGIYHALRIESSRLRVLDSVDGEKINTTAQEIQTYTPQEIVLVVVSKSGDTLETIVNTRELLSLLPATYHARVITITMKGTRLAEQAGARGLPLALFPEQVSGRFSIFSVATVIPLLLLDIPVSKILEGARLSQKEAGDEAHDPAVMLAVWWDMLKKEGKHAHELFVIDDRLYALAQVCRQLIGESLGKNKQGLVPYVSELRDAHSVLQATLDGAPVVGTFFFSFEKQGSGYAHDVRHIIAEAIKNTYTDTRIPHMGFSCEGAEDIGYFLQTYMRAVVYAAKLSGVDPFNQPAIESYKQAARSALQQ